MRLGDGGDLLRLQNAAALPDVYLYDADGLLLKRVREIVLGGQPLAGRDRDARLRGDPRHLLHHLGRDRLLEPDRVELLEHLRHADRAGRAELAVRPDADLELVADRFADVAEDAGDVLDVLQRPVPRVRERW